MMKLTKKRIILACAIFAAVAVLIAGNLVLAYFSPLIHQVFAGNDTDYSGSKTTVMLQKSDELVQSVAAESMVLLKNQKNALPLAAGTKINLFGWNSTDAGFLLTGGGSGGTVIDPGKKVTLQDAFTKAGVEYNTELAAAYADVSKFDADSNADSSSVNALINPGGDFYTQARMDQATGYSDTAVIVLSRYARENGGGGELVDVGSYRGGSFLEPTANEKIMLEKVTAAFNKVIVLLNTCNNLECSFLEDYDVDACLYVGLPGQSGAHAVPRILFGDVSPSGRTADTYAYDYQTNNPVWANAYYNNKNIVYAEGIYTGYRWYETADEEHYFDSVNNKYGRGYNGVVQFPFGYGLSYADFQWKIDWPGQTAITALDDKDFEVKVIVTNVGDKTNNYNAGQDVVQLYVTAPYYEGGIEKPYVSLVAFGKTEILDPGKSQELTLKFSPYDLASYDEYDRNGNDHAGYELDRGDYEMKIMRNAHTVAPDSLLTEGSDAATQIFKAAATLTTDVDPATGEAVVNRFTGTTAYAGIPIDGTVASAEADVAKMYMSRAGDFKTTFPSDRANPYRTSVSDHQYDGYNTDEIKEIVGGYTQKVDSGMRLVTLKGGGNASENDLNGTSGATLSYNDELLKTLWDYDNDADWNKLIDQMSTDDIKKLIGRAGFRTADIVSIGKPARTDRDGPAGFNLGVTNTNAESEWTAYPVEALIGCSWSTKMAYSMGRSQGAEAAATGLSGWYAPGINLHRSPYNSRNFEYYSEDGVLSGHLAAKVVMGAKENNLYCYMKHFAASEAGQNPNNWNTWLTEQTLREIYLKPFEIAVKDGKGNGVMTAFSNIGAVWCGSNKALTTDVLRNEWGFRGSVITDWYDGSYMSYTRGVLGGNDLWLNPSNASANLDLNNTALYYAARLSVKNILYTFVDTYMTASTTEASDSYTVENIGDLTVTKSPFSPLFVVLWVLIDAVIAAGMVVCAIFFFRDVAKDKDPGTGAV